MTIVLLHFSTVQEVMGDYEMPNGIRLRVRLPVSFVWHDDKTPRQQKFRSNTVFSVWAPTSLKGPPTPTKSSAEPKYLHSWESNEVKTIQAATSVYLVEDKVLLRVGFKPLRVRMSDQFDKDGEPILNIDYQTSALPLRVEDEEIVVQGRQSRSKLGKHSRRRGRR